MSKIAVAMIVKNESSCIEKCLKSIIAFAPNIYILDTGSEDNTCEIARKYTDKVFENEYKWNDSFCDARNYIKNKCDAEWIVSIDADNELEPYGYDKILSYIAKAEREDMKSVSVRLVHDKSGDYHYFPNIYKKSVTWKGNIHNHLDIAEDNKSDITITYGYSEAHKKDPDRALRILSKEVQLPGKVREMYYLAREYWYRRKYDMAIQWYNRYLKAATWSPEIADAHLMIAKCHAALSHYDEARTSTLEAINVNNDFKEALEYMADLTGPKNSERWLNWAYQACNQDVLFVRNPQEKKQEFYNYVAQDVTTRYDNIYKRVGELCRGSRVIDLGCGTAQLSKFIHPLDASYDNTPGHEQMVDSQYLGIDFCKEAIEHAVTPNVRCFNLYTDPFFSFCLNGRDIMVFLEVLEHLEHDKEVLNVVPKGRTVILSVPSFSASGHLRRYTERIVRARYGRQIQFDLFERYNMHNGIWEQGLPNTPSHITLARGIKI